ncbi:MAG: helix-turn-helix domain-containing protein [Bacteroidota bacterium]
MTNFDYGQLNYTFGFYQISLKVGITGALVYGRNSYDFTDGTITFIKPNQLIKVENPANYQEASGWTLIFHPDLIRKSELGRTIENYSFFNYEVNEALHLSKDENNTLTDLADRIAKEYQQNIDRHSQEIIIANIEMILKYCKRYYDRQFYTRTNLHQDVISRFESLVRQYYSSNMPSDNGILSVKYCAEKLAMSPNYFGDLVKNETGKSAREYIQEYVIEKAKTKIIGTNQSISEIAYDLGFEYPQGLNRLFKAKTGMSPKEYRNVN